MRTFIRVVLAGAIFLGALLLASLSWAGEVKGKVAVQGLKSAENIAVYIDAIPGKKFDPPAQHLTIDQRKMTFSPRVAVVLQGTTVDFLNSDPVGHNVYWPSISGNKKLAHNLGTWPKGEKKSFQFNDLGVASLLFGVASLAAIEVATPPGCTTVRPTVDPASSCRSDSEKPRTANLLAA